MKKGSSTAPPDPWPGYIAQAAQLTPKEREDVIRKLEWFIGVVRAIEEPSLQRFRFN